jgi:transcriptional regulator with XRE-family HTH domain
MIGDALRLIRTFHDMKQGELGEALGLSNSYISELERNNREPSLLVIHKYAEYFDVPASSILFFAESIGDSKPHSKAKHMVSKKILSIMEFLTQRKSMVK